MRTPDSIKDCLLFALSCDIEFSGHYVHADEFDMVVEKKGIAAASEAWKRIDEEPFSV